MQGFEEAAVLLPSSDGLGYTGERRVEPTAPTRATIDPLDPQADLAQIRAEKRKREIEAMSLVGKRQEYDEVFASSSNDAGDIDAAAARKDALGVASGGVGVRISLREQLRLNKEAHDAAWKEKHNPFRPPSGLSEEDYNMYMNLEEQRVSKHQAQREQEKEDYELFAQALRSKEEAEEAAKKKAEATASSASSSSDQPSSSSSSVLPDLTALDPTLSFSHLTSQSSSASLLAPSDTLTAATPITSVDSIPSSSSTMPPLVILKRKHNADHPHHHPHSDNEPKEKSHKKHKKQKKEKDQETKIDTNSTTATVTPPPPPPPQTNALAGLAAYSSDDEA